MQPRLMTFYTPPDDPLEIVHRDDDLLLVNKPSGLLCVPGKPETHRDCLESRIKAEIPDALLVHRLDLETSGIMVFAMNKRAQRIINRQFEQRVVRKTYEATVAGVVSADGGEIDLPLIADWPRRPLQKVCFESGKPSRTRWRVARRDSRATHLLLFPETGRSHQLRVHLKEIGHPIIGDPFYAPEEIYRASSRLLLHASKLDLRHPADGEWAAWEVACPF
ncbi:MAG: pseudouridine synthase [Pseudomonadota bacterium]